MKLWGGRFTKETNQLVHNFNASISYDQKFYKQDIEGSIAHVTMLAKQKILTAKEKLVVSLEIVKKSCPREINLKGDSLQINVHTILTDARQRIAAGVFARGRRHRASDRRGSYPGGARY